jgi:hypothetical protein
VSRREESLHNEPPQFCSWCGARTAYQIEDHMPLWQRLEAEKGVAFPRAVEEAVHTDAYRTGCAQCGRISHVIGHPPVGR